MTKPRRGVVIKWLFLRVSIDGSNFWDPPLSVLVPCGWGNNNQPRKVTENCLQSLTRGTKAVLEQLVSWTVPLRINHLNLPIFKWQHLWMMNLYENWTIIAKKSEEGHPCVWWNKIIVGVTVPGSRFQTYSQIRATNFWHVQTFPGSNSRPKNRSRFERFERFSSRVWAVWADWAVWKNRSNRSNLASKNRSKDTSFLWRFSNGFSSKILAFFLLFNKKKRLKTSKIKFFCVVFERFCR